MPAALDPRLLDALPPQLRAALEAQVDAQAEASAAEHEARARAEREAADPRAANAGMAGRVARLERLIARLRRARLGAGSERLGLDQLEPVLEGREAAVSEQQVGADAANGVRDTGRATPPAPGATASPGPGASRGAAARGASDRAARPALPVRRRRHGADRRGPRRAARRRAGAPRPGDGAAPPRLSARPRRGGAAPRSAGAAGADRGRAGERGDDRPGRRVEARRSHPPAAPGAASRPVRAWGWIAPRCRTGRGARGVPPPPDRRPIVARSSPDRRSHGGDHQGGAAALPWTRPPRRSPDPGRAGPGRGRTKTGALWAVLRDDRPRGGSDPPGVVFHPRAGARRRPCGPDAGGLRGRAPEAPRTRSGVDAYGGHDRLADDRLADDRREGGARAARGGPRRPAGGLARGPGHARPHRQAPRRGGGHPGADIQGRTSRERSARERVARERSARGGWPGSGWPCGRPGPGRRSPARARPSTATPRGCRASPRRVARAHILARREGLSRHAHDGRVEIDSTLVESQIRPLALRRKNALFAGPDEGGRTWACIASLIGARRLGGVEPFARLRATLEAVAHGHPGAEIDALPPWAPPRPQPKPRRGLHSTRWER